MKDDIPPLKRNDLPKNEISRTRKVLVWVFIIGFWVAYYWYQGNRPKQAPVKIQEDTQIEKRITAPSMETVLGEKTGN